MARLAVSVLLLLLCSLHLCIAATESLPPDVPPTAPTRMPPITSRLRINGTRFASDDVSGEGRVFLAGVNQAWHLYGNVRRTQTPHTEL